MIKSPMLLASLPLACLSILANASTPASVNVIDSLSEPTHFTPFYLNPIKVSGLAAENRIAGEYIVVFKPNTPKHVMMALSGKINNEYAVIHRAKQAVKMLAVVNGFAGKLNKAQLNELKYNPYVKSIEANQVIQLASYDNPIEAKHRLQDFTRSAVVSGAWSVDRLDQTHLPLDQTFSPAATGSGVHAYVIDTGIHTGHLDFAGRAVWDFTASGIGNNHDNNGHGTHLAGLVGSNSYGVAKDVMLHSVKVLDQNGSGTLAGLLEGINYVTNHHQKPAVATIGMSLPLSSALNDAIAQSIAAGVSYSAPAGDESGDACQYVAASLTDIITVAATWSDDRASVYSNKGSCVDIYAPGLYVKSLWHSSDNANNSISHSPVSAAQVAGAAALVLSQDASCTPAQVKAQLMAQATNDVLTEVPLGTANRLLHVPTSLSSYTSCQFEPLAVDTDLTHFISATGAEHITDMNDGVVFDESLWEAKAAGIRRFGHQFIIDSATDETRVSYAHIEFEFELGVKAFGFEFTTTGFESVIRLRLADGSIEQHVLNSDGFAGFYSDKLIVGLEFVSPGEYTFSRFYRDADSDEVSIFSHAYRDDFAALANTLVVGDIQKQLEMTTFAARHDTEQLSIYGQNGALVGAVPASLSGDLSDPLAERLVSSQDMTNVDVTVELHHPANHVSFNTHLAGVGVGHVTVFSGNDIINQSVVNHSAQEVGFFAVSADSPITAIRWQAAGTHNKFSGINDLATDTAVPVYVPIVIAGIAPSSEQSGYYAAYLFDGMLEQVISSWRSDFDDSTPTLEVYLGLDIPATHYRLARGYCDSNDYLAGTWKLYARDALYQWQIVDDVNVDQSSYYPAMTACNQFGPLYQVNNPTASYQYKLEFTASPLSSVSGVSIGEIEFLY